MFKRLFLLTLIFSLGFTSIGLTQTPGGESTVTIGEPFISASTGKVTRYGTCGMVSHDYKDCQNSSGPGIYHPVTFEWKPRDTVDIRISTVASGYGKVRAVLAKVIINGVDKIGGDAGDASRATPTYIGDCGVISTWWSTHAQAYTETKTAACIYTGPAGSVGTTHTWIADGSVEGYSVEWSRNGGKSVGLEVSAGTDGKNSNFTTTLTGSTHKGISSSYSGTPERKPYPGAGNSGSWSVTSGAKCGNDLCTSYDDMTGPHDHHAVCAGCGEHIKCKKRRGNHTQTTCGATSQGSGQGTACTNTPYWNCLPHTHQFGSGSGSGSGQQGSGGNTCSTCATISGTCSECTDALEAGNGNGNGGGNGGTPVSNGGCDTSCINPNCNSSTAHTTYTCVRPIRTTWNSVQGGWNSRPCGVVFTKCQDWDLSNGHVLLRGRCSGTPLGVGESDYHIDSY